MTLQADGTAFKWWLIYGPGRSGTSYVSRWVARCAGREVSDWGLGTILNGLEGVQGIDRDRLRQDIRNNIVDSARAVQILPGGKKLDLVIKQAGITHAEYAQLVKMFGPPQRAIFCLRDPDSYMASAAKKFDKAPLRSLQDTYRRMFAEYARIGGNVLHYGPHLTTEAVLAFLEPLPLRSHLEEFVYRGTDRPDLVTPEMRQDFEAFRKAFCPDMDVTAPDGETQ